MKIKGYTVEQPRYVKHPYWLVKTDDGKIVATLSIHASANRNGFGSTLSSHVSVEVKGPVYFDVANEKWEEIKEKPIDNQNAF